MLFFFLITYIHSIHVKKKKIRFHTYIVYMLDPSVTKIGNQEKGPHFLEELNFTK